MKRASKMAMMEESIAKFCKTMAKFSNHIQSSGTALKESVDRRPIPLDSASTTFLQSVNRRVSAVGGDLNMLESMSFGTVSFEELLGHCNEVLKKNQNDLLAVHHHLRSSFTNYFPPLDLNEDVDVEDCELDDISVESGSLDLKTNKIVEEDPLLDDSLSLKKFGISDVCLATIASQANGKFEMDEPDFQPDMESLEVTGETRDLLNQYEACKCVINVSRDDYESLPKHMKGLVAWEDLLTAVEKMNSYIGTKRAEPYTIDQDEIELLQLGFKARSYLLLLIKMNRLSIETRQGVISYRVL